jgi:hypothetical protein
MLAKPNAAWRASPPPPRRTPRIFKRGQPADCGAGLAPLGGHHGSPSRRVGGGSSRQRSKVATVPAAPVPSRGGRTVHRMQWRPTSPRKHREACCLDGQAPVLVVLWSCGLLPLVSLPRALPSRSLRRRKDGARREEEEGDEAQTGGAEGGKPQWSGARCVPGFRVPRFGAALHWEKIREMSE